LATISGLVFEGGGTGSECFLTATGFLAFTDGGIEEGVDAIFLGFSLIFAVGSAAMTFLGVAEDFGFGLDELTGAASDLPLADPVLISGFLGATTLDFAGFITTFAETLALGDLTTFTGFDGLFAAVFETEAFVFESDDFTGVALAVAATLPLETFEAETVGFSLAVLLILEAEDFCELFGLFFDALNGNSIIGLDNISQNGIAIPLRWNPSMLTLDLHF
jgi:hypothetical protein